MGKLLALVALAVVPLLPGCGLLWVRHRLLLETAAARSWVATPCVMEKCEYVTHTGRQRTRSMEIVYRYEVDGQEYRGDRLDLMIGSFGDDNVMEKRVYESFPAGAKATCYVDPNDPSNSVFDREHAADKPRRLFILAFPFVCTGLGFWFVLVRGFVSVLRETRIGSVEERLKDIPEPAPPPRRIPNNPHKPARNVLMDRALADVMDERHSGLDHLMHCAPALLALGALVLLYVGAKA